MKNLSDKIQYDTSCRWTSKVTPKLFSDVRAQENLIDEKLWNMPNEIEDGIICNLFRYKL